MLKLYSEKTFAALSGWFCRISKKRLMFNMAQTHFLIQGKK
jgi:hypothetical protein